MEVWSAGVVNYHQSFAEAQADRLYLLTDVQTVGQMIPLSYELHQNYPNPFNPSTTITFSIPQKGIVRLDVLDVLGRRITTLVDGVKDPSSHRIDWNGEDRTGTKVSSGVYFYRLETATYTSVRKMVLPK